MGFYKNVLVSGDERPNHRKFSGSSHIQNDTISYGERFSRHLLVFHRPFVPTLSRSVTFPGRPYERAFLLLCA